MKPLYLELENIKSFKEKVCINFKPLLERGLFGIFGKTGSGKSTILQAINIALYYSGSNFDKRDIINTKSETGYIALRFEISNEGKKCVYLVERVFKFATTDSYLYEINGESSICIAEKTLEVSAKITSLIGLDLKEFQKCIALPQGEFAEFINSTGGEKTDLIANLFSLHDYSIKINERTKQRLNQTQKEYDLIKDRLDAYVDDTQEKLTELSANLETLKINYNNALLHKQKSQEKLARLTDILDANNEYKKCMQTLDDCASKQAYIDDLQNKVTAAIEYLKFLGDIERLKEIKNEKTNTNIDYKRIKGKINEQSFKLSELIKTNEKTDYQKQIESFIKTLTLFNDLKADDFKINKLEDDNENLKQDYKKNKELIEKTNQELISHSLELEKVKLELVALNNKDIFTSLKNSYLTDENNRLLNYFTDKKYKLKHYDKKQPLYSAVESELNDRILEYSEKVKASSFKISLTDAADVFEKTNQLNAKIAELENKILNFNEKIKELNFFQKQITEKGTENKKSIESIKKTIYSFTGNKPLVDAIKKTEQNLENARREKELLTTTINDVSSAIDNFKIREDFFKKQLETLFSEEQRINAKLLNFGIKLEDVSSSVMTQPQIDKLNSEIKNHNDLVFYSTKRAANLKDKVDSLVDERQLLNQKEENTQAEELAAKISQEIGKTNSLIETLQERITQKKAIEETYKKTSSELKLVQQLYELVRAKRFLKFVTEEYLADLAFSATRLLLELTFNRYGLHFERSSSANFDNDFYVSDNFDEGKLRKVSTLSGGETFLVSLALAVSLSETIYKKSLRPMEFFFLDEGFGTLDDELVDTVLTSLEKLKNSHFSIGLISHVGELKDRIESKINIHSATADCGSRVEIIV